MGAHPSTEAGGAESHPSGESKVCYAQLAALRDEQVRRLEVPVDDPMPVGKVEAAEQLE